MTTLNIDDTIMAELKREAARQGRTMEWRGIASQNNETNPLGRSSDQNGRASRSSTLVKAASPNWTDRLCLAGRPFAIGGVHTGRPAGFYQIGQPI